MGKKGVFRITNENFMIFAKLLLVIVVYTGFTLIIGNYVDRDLKTELITSYVFSNYILSEKCFGLENEFGIVSLDKFEKNVLNDCVEYNDEFLSANVKLRDKEVEYNNYEGKKELCWQNKYKCTIQSLYVLVNEGDKLTPETMYVEVITLE